MAIRLASAVGQQREPIGILGGLDEAINKTGDAIQADQLRKSEAAAKKKDQEQRLKDAVLGSVDVSPIKALPTQQKEYEDFAKNGKAQLVIASADPNITSSQFKKMQEDFIYGLQDRKIKYGEDYDVITDVAKKGATGENTHDTVLFDNLISGRTNPTQVANMPNDDFMAASEADRAGKMVGENGMQATKTETAFQGTPYWNLPFEEQKKISTKEQASNLVSLKRPDTLAASRGYYGKPFEFEAYTKRTDKISPTTGEYIFEFDEGQVDLDAKKFASSMVGEGNFGNKEHAQYQRALEAEALAAGNEAGFSGDRLAAFVEETVPQMAYDDFMLNAKSAYDKRIKNDKDITKAPSKGLNINFGGAGSVSKGGTTLTKTNAPSPVIQERYAKKLEEIDSQIKELEQDDKVENPKEFHARKIKTLQERKEIYENRLKTEPQTHIKYSSTKKRDDPFVSGYSDGERLVNFQLLDFVEKGDGWYMVGEKKTSDGNIEPTQIPFTQNNYKKLIGEDPDSFEPMEAQGVKPMTEKKETKSAAPKTYKIGNKEWSADKVEKAAKASGMSVDEYIKEIQK